MTIWHPEPNIGYPATFSLELTRHNPPDLERTEGGRRYRVVGDKSFAFWAKDKELSVMQWMLQCHPDSVLKLKPLSPYGKTVTFSEFTNIALSRGPVTRHASTELHRILQNGPLVVEEILTIQRSYSDLLMSITRDVSMTPLGEWTWELPEDIYPRSRRIPYIAETLREFLENELPEIALVHPDGRRTVYPLTVASVNYDPEEFLTGLGGMTDDAERVGIIAKAWEAFAKVIGEQTGVVPFYPELGNAQALYDLARSQETTLFVPTLNDHDEHQRRIKPDIHIRLRDSLPWDHQMHIGPDGDISVVCRRQLIPKAMQAYEVAKFKEEVTGVKEVDAFISAWIEAHANDEE
jgi:hypothetical protein